jgi:broad specificity phosphatase PhoE
MKLYFARHGDTDANEHSAISQVNGEIDEPLNRQGIVQLMGWQNNSRRCILMQLSPLHLSEHVKQPN